MKKMRGRSSGRAAGILAAVSFTCLFMIVPGVTAQADPEPGAVILEDSVTEAAQAVPEIPEIPETPAVPETVSGSIPENLPESAPGESPAGEEYRDDFMEDLGQEDLEALLSGSEDETISEQELQEMVNEWMSQDTPAGLSGSGGRKFSIQDDPETILEYDSRTGEYTYILPDGNEYRMNVPRGGIHVGPVIFSMPNGGLMGAMKKDGVLFYQDDTTFTEPGSYELEFYSGGVDTSGGVDVSRLDASSLGTTRSRIRFRVIPRAWNKGSSITAPEDFSIVSATLNGEPMKTGEEFRLREDGTYHFVFAFRGDSSVRYETEFYSDKTEPEIRLTPAMETGKTYRPPVRFEVPDPEAEVIVLKDGSRADFPGGRIENGGWYSIIARDPAGNENETSFYLQYGMSREAKLLGGIAAAALAGALLWLLYLRTRPRVR